MPPLPAQRQHGLVLIMALIVLAAMTLAAIGLMRSVTGSNRVAGNLAFQQAALQSADVGHPARRGLVGAAIREQDGYGGSANRLDADVKIDAASPIAYVAYRDDPVNGQTWKPWPAMAALGQVNTRSRPMPPATPSATSIHRLCMEPGTPAMARCEMPFVQKARSRVPLAPARVRRCPLE